MNFFISFLDQSLIPNVDGLGKKHFLIVNNNKIITSKGLDLEEDILSELKSKKVLPLKKSEFYTRLHVKNYTVHLARSNIFADWTYIYISSNNSSLFTIDIFISMVTFIILSMVGAWFAFANIRKIYTPIQSVVDVLKPYGFDEEADEIENIKKTAVTISSINEELSRIVKDKSVHMKNKFLTDLLYGMLKEEDIKRMIDEYRLQRFQTPLHIIIIELLNPLGLEEKVNKEKVIEIKNSIAKSISAALEKNCHCTVLELDYRRYAAIATEVNTEILRNVLNNSIYTIEMAYDLELVAAIGKEISSITEAEISFNDAMVILEHKHILSKKAVLTAEELKNVKDISYYYPIDIERNLLLYITNGDREKARAVLQNLLNINLRQHTLSKEGINEFIYAIVATIKRLLQQMNKTVEEVFGEGSILYLELKTCQNIEQLEDKIQEIFKAIITKMHSESIEDDQSLIERMLAFVRENYQKDISLTDISEAFNVSMGYTSRLFKNQANTNFKDYLNLYRIQRAKELFKQGNNVKINDVAMEVGCNNATTFFRIFKKYEGISPGEYMKNMN